MATPHVNPSSGIHNSHFYLPGQMLLGLIFLVSGTLLLLKRFGRDYIPFIPEEVVIWVCIIGSIMGGFYLLLTKIWRPRIYL